MRWPFLAIKNYKSYVDSRQLFCLKVKKNHLIAKWRSFYHCDAGIYMELKKRKLP